MLAIAQANKATIIAIAEVAMYAQSQGVKAHGMNLGGRYVFPLVRLNLCQLCIVPVMK